MIKISAIKTTFIYSQYGKNCLSCENIFYFLYFIFSFFSLTGERQQQLAAGAKRASDRMN